jgi:hypothetical protein
MKMKDIPRCEWSEFFDSFSRRHEHSPVTLEIFGTEMGKQVEERQLTFEGIVDEGDETQGNQIVIMTGGRPDDHITHSVRRPVQVSVEQTDEGADVALEIIAADGITAVLRSCSPVSLGTIQTVASKPPEPLSLEDDSGDGVSWMQL